MFKALKQQSQLVLDTESDFGYDDYQSGTHNIILIS